MNVKAMEQLEFLREEGRFNMMTESTHIIQRANDLEFYDLVLLSDEKSWIDILNDLSEYLNILDEFEAQESEDNLFG